MPVIGINPVFGYFCSGKKIGGLVPVFTRSAVMGAVKPSVRPCIEGRGEYECSEGNSLCGKADDEDGGEGVHGDVFPFVMFLLGGWLSGGWAG